MNSSCSQPIWRFSWWARREHCHVRVAIITESFLPQVNGVTNSVLHVLEHLQREGIDTCVIAPASDELPSTVLGARVVGVPSLALPGYRAFRVGAASIGRLSDILVEFAPDVVHLASPFSLGFSGVIAARRLGIPTVAVYQTDIASYANRYRMAATSTLVERHVARLHKAATLTLVPSSASWQQLAGLGVDRLATWGRGVDSERFHPSKRRTTIRDRFANGEVIVGYVGRLAKEKQVDDLAALVDLPGIRLVVIGDGPSRAALEKALPSAHFTGALDGEELAEAMASLDIFVHPGESDTFGQTLQEAHASGVAVVATGAGGPVDLVRSSVDGWLYQPGNLTQLRERIADLVGDARKRAAFGEAGRERVEQRTWARVCAELVEHYRNAITLNSIDNSARRRRTVRPVMTASVERVTVRRYVALGDSLTEGLTDLAVDGSLRGWADRLAQLLGAESPLDYANVAVRSRKVRDVVGTQTQRALVLRADLVSILVGANDLVGARVNIPRLLADLEGAVAALRASGAEVILVTPFLPQRKTAVLFATRFARFASGLSAIADRTGAKLLDTDLSPEIVERECWAEDLVHLNSRGHRILAYRAAGLLGVADAEALAGLEAIAHEVDKGSGRGWWREHAFPWIARRLRGRTAGDGRSPKHEDFIRVGNGRVSAVVQAPALPAPQPEV